MKISDLMTKQAKLTLKNIDGEDLPITITIKNSEDKEFKRIERELQLTFPETPKDGSTDKEHKQFIFEADVIYRKIISARIVRIDGFDDFDNSRGAIDNFIEDLPVEYIEQIDAFIAERKNFF